jgi:ZIP family zinc transporter
MKQVTGNSKKAFLFGMGSGVVEPLSAIVGFFLASHLIVLQPWLLAFSAGAMLFVVAEDLIPDANLSENPHTGTWGFMIGFIIMMILDVALG